MVWGRVAPAPRFPPICGSSRLPPLAGRMNRTLVLDDDQRSGIFRENTMAVQWALGLAICLAAASIVIGRPAMAQACTPNGPEVRCDDGRRGLLSGDAI